MSEDREDRLLTEFERLSIEHRELTSSQCHELSQSLHDDVAQLTELTQQCHGDVIARVNTASEHLLHEILGFIESMLVLII